MLRAGLYARVSTLDRQTLPMQMRAMRHHAANSGWTVTMQVKEVGSGATAREQRQQLIDSARRREIDVGLVWRLDRWGRSPLDPVTTLQELTDLNIGFVSLSEALDLTTSAGRAMAGMLSVFAAFEHDILRDRVRAGLDHARQSGTRLGLRASIWHCSPLVTSASGGLSRSSRASCFDSFGVDSDLNLHRDRRCSVRQRHVARYAPRRPVDCRFGRSSDPLFTVRIGYDSGDSERGKGKGQPLTFHFNGGAD